MKFLEVFIDSIIMWVAAYFVGRMLFEKKNKLDIFKLTGIVIIFSLLLACLNMIESELLGGTVKILCVYILQCLFYKVAFKEKIYKVIAAALILYLCLCASEAIVVLSASLIFKLSNIPMTALKNHIMTNFFVSIVEIITIKILKKRLSLYVKNSDLTGISNRIVIIVILITLALLGFKMPLTSWGLNIEFIVTMMILISFCAIGILILKQKSDIQKTKSMYQQLVEYSNITNNVLEEYRVVTHEHNNQLLIIRSMLENKDKDINDYVDNLLEKREGIKYKWIGELNHLPLSGLKGLINYKVLEMESLKLNKVISISKEVSKIKLEKLSMSEKDNLYSIIGVYLDNAIQAAKESKEKEINIEIYKEKTEMVIIIANTYNGKIEIDKLDNYGYTTKGKNHGIGLHIVKNIINNETIFNSKTYLIDNYFVQEMRIDLKQIKAK